MPKVAIVVEFRIKPGMERDFEAHIREHASKTLEEEAGCERFDVLQALREDGSPETGRMMVYEIYASHDAVAAHRANPRMKVVGPRGAAMMESRTLTMYEIAAT